MKLRDVLMLSVGLGVAACGNAEPEAAPVHKGPVAFGYVLAPAAKPRAGMTLPLGKCVNMGGMLERQVEGDNGRPLRDSDFKIIKAAGFSTVRIPIRFSVHTDPAPPYAIDPVFLARVQHVVKAALDAGLNVMIDVHHYKELMADPQGHSARFTAIWKQIADTFKGAPDNLWFELLNEPGGLFWNKVSPWVVYRPALAAIRKVHPTRPVIIAGGLGSRVESLLTLQMPDDPNLVPTFHFYYPKEFTHQGASWTTLRYPLGRRLLDSDRAIIDENIAAVKAYMDRTGRVPFLGEYGAIDKDSVQLADRVRYHGWVSSGFASIGVQSCAWAYTNGFSMYRDGAWLPGMLEATQTTTTLLPK